jgi:pimeloyl-ACP methyl ester carboxylesterase
MAGRRFWTLAGTPGTAKRCPHPACAFSTPQCRRFPLLRLWRSSRRPSEQAHFSDSLVIFDRLVRRSVGGPILLVGFSLVDAVAADIAKHRPLSDSILVRPFDSREAVALDLFWSAPVGSLLRNRMPTIEVVCGSNVPTALITARRDTIVPNRCSARLRAAIKNSVFSSIDVGHIDLCDHLDFAKAVREALRVEATSDETSWRSWIESQVGAHPRR